MLRIGIAEDDFRVASIHEGFLSKMDDVKIVFKELNAEDTINKIKSVDIDLLLLDIYMPDRLGTELINDIRMIKPELGIIMISAATEKEVVKQALQLGVFDYIIKPVTMDRFIETIEKYRKFQLELDQYKEIDQTFLDQYFGFQSKNQLKEDTPKGIDPLSLQKVNKILREESKGFTAEEMGERMGASRTTARRYLEYLISIGECYAELEYGIVGRPERHYYANI
ncbi:response regulator [Allobacillus halotolerans]|uniref:Response regulator n=1 Tax=Allobacillus halotolerans TaxID=570278 RepID=A0ABS6GL62_9BACI|nr:response regulator [Allobacillus halotolerans]MBU6079872.1 response regulator [Allobacillus halotolerans]